MVRFTETVISLTYPVKSLCWQDNRLVDIAGGYRRFTLAGEETRWIITYPYRFDAAILSPSGRYAVIYEQSGTKGLILEDTKIIRQINRDYYFADSYEYPITFARLPDGREAVIHCPSRYRQMEIEDIETGNRLTEDQPRKAVDIFYSRLATSADGRYLLTAGWIWHPANMITLHDLTVALAQPQTLDGYGIAPNTNTEIDSVTFWGNDRLILAGGRQEPFDHDDMENTEILQNGQLGVYDLQAKKLLSSVLSPETIGTIMPVNDEIIVSFYKHPKLINVKTGEVVQRWEHIQSGQQASSFTEDKQPSVALDTTHQRFAVAHDKTIHIIQLHN